MKRGKEEQQLSLTYCGGPLALAGGMRTATLRVGDRAPDARLFDAGGAEPRLFDVLRGPDFTAIAYGPGAARDLERFAWPTAGARLKRLAVGLSFCGLEKTLRRAYGLTGDTLLLIRPDGYIGHIAARDFLTTTHTAVRAMTP